MFSFLTPRQKAVTISRHSKFRKKNFISKNYNVQSISVPNLVNVFCHHQKGLISGLRWVDCDRASKNQILLICCDSNENDHQGELLKQLNRTIHESEIREQIDKAKRGKSPSADGILNELIKLAKEKLIPSLKMLFNTIFDYSIFPSSWHLGIITSIFKKERRNNPSNYRSISLLSNLGKVLTGILNTRIGGLKKNVYSVSLKQASVRADEQWIIYLFSEQ